MSEEQIRPEVPDEEVEAHKKAPASPERHLLNDEEDEVEAHKKAGASPERHL